MPDHKERRPRVLIIEDNPRKAGNYLPTMELEGIEGVWKPHDTIQQVVEWAEAEVRAGQFDFLLLDLNMGQLYSEVADMTWGGMDIYLAFKHGFVLDRCGEVLVASAYPGAVVKGLRSDSSMYIVKIFLEMGDISYDNYFDLNRGGGIKNVIKRIKELWEQKNKKDDDTQQTLPRTG